MTLRIGILGAARIAPGALIEPAAEIDGVTVSAVAARDRSRAEAFAAEHEIPNVFDDYDELCSSETVDAVYVALPASHHRRWSITAMRAGKDVLCEKPMAMNAVEAAEMVAVAEQTDRVLMEAFHWRYHPFASAMKTWLDTMVGDVESVSAVFDVAIADPGDIRYQVELGGGALMDLGCYPLNWVRYLLGPDPTVESATAVEQPAEVDQSLAATLRFPRFPDARVDISCSMAPEADLTAKVEVVGSAGRLVAVNPLAPHRGNRLEFHPIDGPTRTAEPIEGPSTYHHQLAAFVEAVRTRVPPPTSGAESVANMATIDACYRAAGMKPRGLTGRGRPVEVDRSGVDNCFGCGQANDQGLRLAFEQRADGTVEAVHHPAAHHCGLDTVVHGGIQATILDEVMGVAAQLSLPGDAGDAACVTAEMSLRYRRPVPMDGPVVARATVEQIVGRDIHVTGRIVDDEGQPLTEATSRWRQLRV